MIGPLIIYALLGVAFLLSIPAASHTGLATWVSLAASSVAFVAMAINQFLATRPRIFEGLFAGLDRMYRSHKTMGKIALVLIILHYNITPNFKGQTLTSGLTSYSEDAATIGFWLLMFLIGISLIKKIPFTSFEIPYHLWRHSHRFIGVAFMFIAFHQMFIKRPFDGNALLAGYLNVFAVVGIASYLYIQIAPFVRRKSYEVVSIDRHGGATLFTARPISSALKSVAGQFALIHFDRPHLREPHPFTIAKSSDDGDLSFAIKACGDFTNRLHEQLKVGDKLLVEGAYGRFKFDPHSQHQLWLAGGIGITPLLAMAQTLNKDHRQHICLVHCIRNEQEAVDAKLLSDKAEQISNFSYVQYCSEENGRLNGEKLKELISFDLNGAALFFCGPPPLRVAITEDLKKNGAQFSSAKFEIFEFR